MHVLLFLFLYDFFFHIWKNFKIILMKKNVIVLLVLLTTFLISLRAQEKKDFSVKSPNEDIELSVKLRKQIFYQVSFKGKDLFYYSPISMTLDNGRVIGASPELKSSVNKSIEKSIETVWGNQAKIPNNYNELILQFDDYEVVFRVYDDGAAYRIKTNLKGEITVKEEEVMYRFLDNEKVKIHTVGGFYSSWEELYEEKDIKTMDEKDLVSLPMMVKYDDNVKMLITEADLYDYPGLYLKKRMGNNRFELCGTYPPYPTKTEVGGWSQFDLRVTETANYIAKTSGQRAFPWRVLIITDDDKELAYNNMVYKLSRPLAIDAEWIEPGKVAWEWWNYWNLEGVDFEAGINNQTYKYYIDFAAKNGLKYVIMDEGWSDQFDLTLQRPDIDVQELVEYADEKGVKLILWCVWYVLDEQQEKVLPMFKEWGIAGVKVDFIDRDDQVAVNFYEDMAKACAEHNLLIDYHGCSKPTGLHRMYPNLINYEGVRGNEYNKFNTNETPDHSIDIVFTRMVTGPIDYTPGAMRNSTEGNFNMSNSKPMSHGTRCHQLGMFVVFDAPLQMLCDAPTEYEKYPDILNFLSKVPVSWDKTIVLHADVEKYIVVARQKDDDWYVGGLTNWDEREMTIDFSFLPAGNFKAEILKDGINANRNATDYIFEEKSVNNTSKMKITLKKGGGFAMRLYK